MIPPDSNFHPTRWTLVLRSRGQDDVAKAALSDLCAAYYGPVVSFLRREERSEDAARETAHAFFESILTGGVGAPDPSRGRFRSYLLGALKHFLSKSREAAQTGKRGGGAEHLPLDSATDIEPSITDDTLLFDREWALTLLARALASLEREHVHKTDVFLALKPWLDGGATCSQSDAAHALGLSETAVKVAIHRLRVRFRKLIRAEIAATVDDPEDIAGELSHLITIASAG